MLRAREEEQSLKQNTELKQMNERKYHQFVHDSYKATVNMHNEKQKEDQLKEKEDERRKMIQIQQDLNKEKQRNAQMKSQRAVEASTQIELKKKREEIERMEEYAKKQEELKLMKTNATLEEQREKQYKDFFKQYDSNMSKRMERHVSNVTTQEVERQTKLNELERKNHEVRLEQQMQQELDQETKRKLDILNANLTNKGMIGHHENEKHQTRLAYNDRIAFRKQQEEQQKKALDARKKDEQQKKDIYRETLNYQTQIAEINKDRFGTMTQVEKEMNRPDLNSYKHQNNQVTGMVPGLHNLSSIGSAPTLRKAATYHTPAQNPAIEQLKYKSSLNDKTD